MLIEVCVDSVESALNAVRGGANRLELCANLGLGGGTTPSLGLLKSVLHAVAEDPHDNDRDAPMSIMIMIRPRTGDFMYSDLEMEVMLEDIRLAKQIGSVTGFVLGVLTRDGRVDAGKTQRLAEECLPLEVCFHRAFDMTRDANEALKDISTIGGITRILTSGHGKSVSESLDTLASLLQAAQSRDITVMPGSGINPSTVAGVLEHLLPLGLSEIHLSAGKWIEGDTSMSFRREGMSMGTGGKGEWGVWKTDESIVKEVRRIVDEGKNVKT